MVESQNDFNGKSVVLRSEICASWGYGFKLKRALEFASYLETLGMKVSFTEKKIYDRSIFSIIQEVDGIDNPIFSNDSAVKGAVIGSSPDKTKFEAMQNKLIIK